jgi:hypothetical protein
MSETALADGEALSIVGLVNSFVSFVTVRQEDKAPEA